MAKRKPEKLTHTFIKSVAKEGRYGDGRGGLGLSLLVQKTKNGRWSKTWSQRLHIGKARQEYTPGLGSWPLVTLADARAKAFENARLVKQGIDIRQPAAHVPTVAEAFETVIALNMVSPKYSASHHEIAIPAMYWPLTPALNWYCGSTAHCAAALPTALAIFPLHCAQ